MNDRLPIWRTLSELFLDTELDEKTFKYIAAELEKSGVSTQEAERILWNEVFPVLESNLTSVAGVWDGWSDEWLIKHIKETHENNTIQGNASVVEEIKRCWTEVLKYLPKDLN